MSVSKYLVSMYHQKRKDYLGKAILCHSMLLSSALAVHGAVTVAHKAQFSCSVAWTALRRDKRTGLERTEKARARSASRMA